MYRESLSLTAGGEAKSVSATQAGIIFGIESEPEFCSAYFICFMAKWGVRDREVSKCAEVDVLRVQEAGLGRSWRVTEDTRLQRV
jgi:hypothetical protein